MRTENSTPSASAVTLIRTQLSRARRSVWARGPAVRWLGAAAALAIIATLGYLATTPSTGKYLGEGHAYSVDEIAGITRALQAQSIEYRVEDDRRIGVAADRYSDAMAVVAKLDLGPRTIAELRKQGQESEFWVSLTEKERLELRKKEEVLEAMLRNLDDIVSAYVTIHRTRTRIGRPATTVSAFVYLETRNNRVIGPKTVQSIKGIIMGNEPELKPDAIAVWDRKGTKYLDPSDPGLDESSRTRAREEEVAQEILEDLSWIRGVKVLVKLTEAPPHPPAVEPAPPVAPSAAAANPAPLESNVAVNEPLEDLPPLPPSESPAPPVPETFASQPEAAPAVAKPAAEMGFARVRVEVPQSFYYRKALPNRNPSREELLSIQRRTEAIIESAVGYVLPPGTFEVAIEMIPDDVVLRDSQAAPVVPETRRRWPSWAVPAVAGGVVGALLLALGVRWLATRRPRRAPAAEPVRGRFAAETGPGPSERVRELIRHNPKAAASVLHRWIGQGGHVA